MAFPGPSSDRTPFMSLRGRCSPLPIAGLPFIGPHTSNFTSAVFASSVPTQSEAVVALASTNAIDPSLAYGLSYVLWLPHLTADLGSMEYGLPIPRLKHMGSCRLALTRESSSACLFILVLQSSSYKYRKHPRCTENALLHQGP